MKTSNSGVDFIRSHEGLVLTAYKCPAGVWTIGYGHTKGVKQGDRITEKEAIEYLKEDLEDSEKAVSSQNLKLNQNQFDALVSFTFNVGSGNFKSSTLLKKAKANPNDPTIRNEFAKWNKAKVKGVLTALPGLTRRRKEEADLYFK
ncbi:lysozyme [Dysgonomonas sp. 520]|uniref:lysozyme n=1 Tax=Dysgonomonas sp. 520 TaxID=2302931 RepID=UPI0013D04B06|nr:lysozyme [Dysgonomonas sp. 520]NDW10456.1 lysozyme [Dysgonomonas sp. 520]